MTLVTFTDYAIPNVSIDVETVQRRNLVSRVVEDVSNYMSGSTQNGGVHIISLTKSDATTIANLLSTKGLVAQSLTSETAADTRLSIMTEWKQGDFRILSSTINCGIDSPVCDRVIVVGGS
jgi:superfamily II DNA or RNA helicase